MSSKVLTRVIFIAAIAAVPLRAMAEDAGVAAYK